MKFKAQAISDTSVAPKYSNVPNKRAFFITAFALFLLTTGLTIGTYFIGDKELVTTCIFWLGLIFTVAVSLRGLYLYCLPQSSIENDV